MNNVTYLEKNKKSIKIDQSLLAGKRRLTQEEIAVLEKNHNYCDDWQNIYVPEEEGAFDAELLRENSFEGYVILGQIKYAKIKYHDLELSCGIVNSFFRNSIVGDDCALINLLYCDNYRIGDRVILFNVHELSCTSHSKFGNGIIGKGEKDENRTWIGICNENDGRAVLPFETMIPADAFIWSRNRADRELQKRFVELTDKAVPECSNTFGIIESDVVIKNTGIIKDSKICSYSYIKGASKIKNVTVLSNEQEQSQIGEGVELVNGIMGAGSRVFYQAVGVRFVLGRNCQLKYGARLINSVLGDNSTVSCCELLNNLIFPFHEQHHNSSFLIATTVMGQSNIAAGATIGSNHNSRSPDGEIIAGRGFWPGLCSDFKHNSRFASFVLAVKGSYQHELDIQFPFSLISTGENPDSPIHVIPAWWFMYDMFAIVRNKYKFSKRDKRFNKIQNIEFDPFAPDTMQEVVNAVEKIINLTAANLSQLDVQLAEKADSAGNRYQAAKDYLHTSGNSKFILYDGNAQKKFGAFVYKPLNAYLAYRQVIKYYAARTLMKFCRKNEIACSVEAILNRTTGIPLYTDWKNAGGQIMPLEKLNELYEKIKNGQIDSWQSVHEYYNCVHEKYLDYSARYAIHLLEYLYSCKLSEFTPEIFKDIKNDVSLMADHMYSASFKSREKDFTDYYRCMPYKSDEEMTAVLGSLKDNSFLKELKADTHEFKKNLETFFSF